MENKYLIGIGVIALGVFAYSRYAKKDNSAQGEDPNTGGTGGGGVGGGAFLPLGDLGLPTNPASPIVSALVGVTPTSRGTVVVAAPTTQMNNPLQSGIKGSGITGTGINTGGITGAGISATSMTANVKDTSGALKMFDGSSNRGKTTIYLNDLVRSWNRP
jgi:hypothetical protein